MNFDRVLGIIIMVTCAFTIYVGSAWIGKNVENPPFGVVHNS